jgi:hypothetical protein
MIDEHSKSWMICPDPNCELEPITSDKYPYEILIDLGIQVHQKSKPPPIAKRKKAAIAQRGCGQGRKKK